MIIQLNPYIPVMVEGKGSGYAIGWMDYSQDHHLMWIVALDNGGEVWTVENPLVRLQANFSMGRTVKLEIVNEPL